MVTNKNKRNGKRFNKRFHKLAPICLDDLKLNPKKSTHKDNLNRLLTLLVLNKIPKLKNEYFYGTQEWLGDLYKSSPKIFNKI